VIGKNLKIFSLTLCAFFFGQISWGAPISAPETIVEISARDLIRNIKIKEKESLPSGYGKEVARLIQSSKTEMLTCLDDTDKIAVQFLMELSIGPEGKASTSQKDDEILTEEQECVLKILSSLSYPKHKLKKALVIQLPISLKKDTL
jgi:hypothetical protein